MNAKKKKVLIIDDSHDILEVTSKMLAAKGYETTTLADGSEVMQSVRNNPPDIIFLDMFLGLKSGMDLCKELKSFESTKQIPVILTTGNIHAHAFEFGDSAAVKPDDYLLKPFEIEDIITKIEQHLG